jgi:Uma2 family endonuclease
MGKTARLIEPDRLVVNAVDWLGYLRFLRAFEERPGYRLTYDRGTLEIMNVTYGHERFSYFLGRMVDVLTEELGMPVAAGRTTTFKRRKKKRGLEPDNCYWIANEPRVRGKDRIDLRTDPPPDLALEVDVTNSSLDRMSIYAALGVPEVWRLQDTVLTFNVLTGSQRYAVRPVSITFPGLASGEIARFLSLQGQIEENTLIRQFRAWVQQQIVAGVLVRQTP